MICNLCGTPNKHGMLGVLFSRTGLRLTSRPQDSDTHLCAQCFEGLLKHDASEILAALPKPEQAQWPDELPLDARMI